MAGQQASKPPSQVNKARSVTQLKQTSKAQGKQDRQILEREMVMLMLLALVGVAALGYVVDQKYLLSNDVCKSWRVAFTLAQAKTFTRDNTLVADLFEQGVRKWPHRACMKFEDRTLTFAQVDEMANRVAHWALQRGLRAGQTVGLLMENRPEYVALWLGLSKVGVATALINTHLQADGLVHSVTLAGTNDVIIGAELLDKVAEVHSRLPGVSFHTYNDATLAPPNLVLHSFAQSLDAQLKLMDTAQPPVSHRSGVNIMDTALLIFTSGTTGLPKAARVSHFNVVCRSLMFVNNMQMTEADKIYTALPLYHTSGGNMAVGMMLNTGATLCISRRFSTTKFWDEVCKFECTTVQYIGEMCRYLMNAPPKDNDKDNRVRIVFGNGLRPDVWAPFQERFGIPAVFEFYGSTEGVSGMVNMCTTPEDQGHLGRQGLLISLLLGNRIVKYDVDNDEYIRDSKTGFLRLCDTNEVGELICPINQNDPAKRFHGYYKNEGESNKKVLRDVFKKGDLYFRTGDLFKVDERSCWHFVDRIGDTFRWKGENVATNEVSEAISNFPGLSEICVYGVEVPGNEGRACLAAVVFDESAFDLSAFAQHVKKRLPSYAMPLFIRQLDEVTVTGTMKHMKAKLRKEGMDPLQVHDKLWFFNKAADAYERLTSENYHSVIANSRL